MLKLSIPSLLKSSCIACVFLLAACSPKYDWREVRGSSAPFTVLLPAKPATHTRTVNLDGIQVTMTMTAAEVDEVTFAVGATELPETAQAQKALIAIKTALVRNIGGTVKQEKSSAAGSVPTVLEVEASGTTSDGQPRMLLARFVAKDKHVYQVLMAGKEKAMSRDAADTFFTSFKTNY